MTDATPARRVSIIGLGIMGGAYARHLLAAGWEVTGHDPSPEAMTRFAELGGSVASDAAAAVTPGAPILLALPSPKVLAAVTEALAGVVTPGTIIAEMGTLPLEAKEAARDRLAEAGAVLLDCPVSGTGAQAAVKDLVIFASGPPEACAAIRPVFADFARDIRATGAFGTGMKLKYIANLLVSIHNMAAAEALLLAERSGLDLQMTYDAIRSGAGNSRMFEVRGPLMISGEYEPATMKMDIYMKDVMLILDHARETRTPVPLMAATLPWYTAALAEGRDKQDTAALFEVLRQTSEFRKDQP